MSHGQGDIMGLDVGVGWLARWSRELDEEEFQGFREPYDSLNELLAEAGVPRHHEPLDIPEDQTFDAQMIGYSGLHTVRRLAAYYALERRLPPEPGRRVDASKDAVLGRIYEAHASHYKRQPAGWLSKLLRKHPQKPKFQHLLWHSDCEGFYVPIDFDEVILDNSQPQLPGLGGMIGSTRFLLEECRELARLIGLPPEIDPEDDRLWEAAEADADTGPAWQVYGTEAFCLARLIRACELSLHHKAVVVFG